MIKVYGWKMAKTGSQEWGELLKTQDARTAKRRFDALSSAEVVLVQGKRRQVLASKNCPNTRDPRARYAQVRMPEGKRKQK